MIVGRWRAEARFRLRFAHFRQHVGANFSAMPTSSNNNGNIRRTGDDFRISDGPVARSARADLQPFEVPEFLDLSAVGAPFLCAIPRDPRTLFAYWQIDWGNLFAVRSPADRQVHVRLSRRDSIESTTPAEPMSGNCYLTAQPGETYRVEIGYYDPEETWNPVALSDEVTMPAEGVAQNDDVDLASIPLHLSFQRLIDLFRAQNGEALAEIIGRLQRRAVTEDERALLTSEDWEILRAMDLSVEDFAAAHRNVFSSAQSEKLRQRAEAVLGFGATSPSGGFGGSSQFGGGSWS